MILIYFLEPAEYNIFCSTYNFTNDFTVENFLPILNYDYLLSSKFIQQNFINYMNGDINLFSSKAFINYQRCAFGTVVLGGLITTRSVQELLYGYYDPFLTMISSINYYTGGDPSINPFFSLMLNMTETPNDPNKKWSFYTGKNDSDITRQYKTTLGSKDSNIV